jgi:hypothetical protein
MTASAAANALTATVGEVRKPLRIPAIDGE